MRVGRGRAAVLNKHSASFVHGCRARIGRTSRMRTSRADQRASTLSPTLRLNRPLETRKAKPKPAAIASHPSHPEITSQKLRWLAGAPGFEPGNGGIKIHCLTTWLRPNRRAEDSGLAEAAEAAIPPPRRHAACAAFFRASPCTKAPSA